MQTAKNNIEECLNCVMSHGAFTHAADRTCPDLSFDPRLGEKHEPSISLFFKKSVTMSLASY